jgi:signal transduction histidine kinase
VDIEDRLAAQRLAIARDLHDGIAQDLVAVGYLLDSIIGRAALDQTIRSDLRQVREVLSSLTSRVRDEIFNLRAGVTELDLHQLIQALTQLFDASGIELEIQAESDLLFEEGLVKAILELARNAREHSGASRFALTYIDGAIDISDNGSGAIDFESSRFGIRGVFERLDALGYTCTFDSARKLYRISRNKP